jgi:hypothetical protein
LIIRSTTGIIITLFYLFLRFPKTGLIIIFFISIVLFTYDNIDIPQIGHYKIDEIISGFVTSCKKLKISLIMLDNFELDKVINVFLLSFHEFYQDMITFDSHRTRSLINTFISIVHYPFGIYFDASMFERVTSKLPLSGPLLFLRSFGILGLLYILLYFYSFGRGNAYRAFLVILLAALYSPNGSWIVLAAALNEYRKKINY